MVGMSLAGILGRVKGPLLQYDSISAFRIDQNMNRPIVSMYTDVLENEVKIKQDLMSILIYHLLMLVL